MGGPPPFVLFEERMNVMRKCRVQRAGKEAFQNPIAAFVLGALCGLVAGMLYMPFSKGIVIGSHNGSKNQASHEMRYNLNDTTRSDKNKERNIPE